MSAILDRRQIRLGRRANLIVGVLVLALCVAAAVYAVRLWWR